MSTLYLLPMPLHDQGLHALPADVIEKYRTLDYFAAERARTLRRFLRQLFPDKNLDAIEIVEYDKHADTQPFNQWLTPVKNGRPLGLVSEAGCPGIADPGALLVSAAHHQNIDVAPLTGPSSLILALMASGLNGQAFQFHGYLPRNRGELEQTLRRLEQESRRHHNTQLLIETPYRNQALLNTLLHTLHPDTRLCIASSLTGPDERITTLPVGQWKGIDASYLDKIPAVFLFLAV